MVKIHLTVNQKNKNLLSGDFWLPPLLLPYTVIASVHAVSPARTRTSLQKLSQSASTVCNT